MSQKTIEIHEISVAVREVASFVDAINDNLVSHEEAMTESLGKLSNAVTILAETSTNLFKAIRSLTIEITILNGDGPSEDQGRLAAIMAENTRSS